MRIDSVRLDAFGRFCGLELHFAPGFNLIFGPNESGKSTLVRFIRGMLYGAARPIESRRELLDEFKALRPWVGKDFCGMMLVSMDDGRRLRVERSFEPPEAHIFDESTGRELSLRRDRRKEPTFFEEALGLSAMEFESTACVGQLEVGMLGRDEAAAKALATRMASPHGTQDPAEKAIGALKARRDEIGSDRATSKPYCQALEARERLRRRLREIEQLRPEVVRLETERKKLEAEIASAETQLGRLDAELKLAEEQELGDSLRELDAKLRQLERLLAERAELERQCRDLAPMGAFRAGEAERLAACLGEYRARVEAQTRLATEVRQKEEKLGSDEAELARLCPGGNARAKVLRLAELERSRAELERGLAQLRGHLATRPAWSWTLAALATGAAALLLGFAVSEWFLALAIVSAVLAVMAASSWLRRRSAVLEAAMVAERLKGLDAGLEALAGPVGAADIQTLKDRLLKAAALEEDLERSRAAIDALKAQRHPPAEEKLKELLDALAKAAPLSDRLRAAVQARAVGEAEIEEFTRLQRAFLDCSNRLEGLGRSLEELWSSAAQLAGSLARRAEWAVPILRACEAKDVQALAKALAECKRPSPHAHAPPSRPIKLVRTEKEQLERQLRRGREELGRILGALEEKCRALNDHVPVLKELEEQERKLSEMEFERQAIDRAIRTIESVADEMRKDFVPRLAARLGPLAKTLTAGRYTDVRVDESFRLNVLAPEMRSFVPYGRLSEGAFEQLGFALRLAAALELTEGKERVPIVCDDTLAQFDDERAGACIGLLNDISKDRQVLMFSCRARERDVAERFGANVIELKT